MRAGELAGVLRAGAEAVSGIGMLREEGLPAELYGPAAVRRSLEAMAAKAAEIGAREEAGMTYRNPVLAWLNEASPQSTPRTEPPPWNAGMWQVTRSEIIIRKDQAPVVHIWFAAIPAVPGQRDIGEGGGLA